jgi:O-antigen/teichoic acid export membrane protein
LALGGVIPFGLLWLCGESILTIVLGKRWAEAGRYTELLAPWLFTLWLTVPASTVMIVLRKQSILLSMHLGILVCRLGVFIAAYALSATPEWTLRTFAIVSTVCQVGLIANSFRLVHHADQVVSLTSK